ncbi:MAG: hypothetical protein U1E38_03090 [Rhodospirillales bacterium]
MRAIVPPMSNAAFAAARTQLPDAPALAVGVRTVAWLPSVQAEAEALSLEAAAQRIRRGEQPIVCHARSVARRLRLPGLVAYDVLELFAFVRPARFCVPSPRNGGTAAAAARGAPRRRDGSAVRRLPDAAP